jgi:hypothetical protein
MDRDIYEQMISRVHRAPQDTMSAAYGFERNKPYAVNTSIEDLVNGSLAHRGKHETANTEQKALDGIATVVLRELSNRTKEIERLRIVEAELNAVIANGLNIMDHDRAQFRREIAELKSTANIFEKDYKSILHAADTYEAIIAKVRDLLPEGEYDIDATPSILRQMLEKIVERGLAGGIFDDSTVLDSLWRHLSKVTNRDPDSGNRLPAEPDEMEVYGVATLTVPFVNSGGTATATGQVNTGVLDVKAVDEKDSGDA